MERTVTARIIIVDDDRVLAETIAEVLADEGYETEVYTDSRRVVDEIRSRPVDLLILDVLMPRKDGLNLTREIRQESSVPIILLSAKGETGDRVIGLRSGADDYISKPFDTDELIERVRTILRRSGRGDPALDAATSATGTEDVINYGDLSVDLHSQEVWLKGDRLTVTPTEFRLLACLVRNADRTVPRQQLLQEVWGLSKSAETRTVDMHVWRLREKLPGTNPNSPIIETVRGFGYRLRLSNGHMSQSQPQVASS
jgi:DNA-binding response OmpR family regulator